jgi:hypothetical protein
MSRDRYLIDGFTKVSYALGMSVIFIRMIEKSFM